MKTEVLAITKELAPNISEPIRKYRKDLLDVLEEVRGFLYRNSSDVRPLEEEELLDELEYVLYSPYEKIEELEHYELEMLGSIPVLLEDLLSGYIIPFKALQYMKDGTEVWASEVLFKPSSKMGSYRHLYRCILETKHIKTTNSEPRVISVVDTSRLGKSDSRSLPIRVLEEIARIRRGGRVVYIR